MTTAAAIALPALLAVGVGGALARPRRAPVWAPACLAAVLAVAGGLITPAAAQASVATLGDALLFLLAAVPLAVLLDASGFFGALARRLDGAAHPVAGLWLVAAATTAVLNLDTAVVLLRREFRRCGCGVGTAMWAGWPPAGVALAVRRLGRG